MRRSAFLLSSLFLIASLGVSCSGDGADGTTTPSATSATSAPSAVTTTSLAGAPPGTLTYWVPSSVGLARWFEIEIAPGLADSQIIVEVEEPRLAYSEIEAAVTDGVASGELAGRLVVVPEVIGLRLVDAGVLHPSDMTVFSTDDPELWANTLGVLIAFPVATGEVGASGDASLGAAEAVFRPGSPAAVPSREDPAVQRAREAQELVEDTAEAYVDKLIGDVIQDVAGDLLEIAGKELTEVGLPVMGKVLCSAGLIITAADFSYTMYQWADAVSGANEAHSGAATSATGTAYQAIGLLSNLRTDLYLLRSGMLSGEICTQASASELERIEHRTIDYLTAGRDAAADMSNEGKDTSEVEQLLDNAESAINDLTDEVRDEVATHTCGPTAGASLVYPPGSIGTMAVVETLLRPGEAAFATLLTGQKFENAFERSDGEATAHASGSTDIVITGNVWASFGPGSFGPELLGPAEGSCGQLPEFWTAIPGLGASCANSFMPPEGNTAIFSTGFAAEIPPACPVNARQYGLVFADGDPSTGYVPHPAYPMDTYQGADRIYDLMYYPGGGWDLQVFGPDFSPLDSHAIVVRLDNSLTWFIPGDELAGMESYRMTAYAHDGGWGMDGGFWNGDVVPEVTEPMLPIGLSVIEVRDPPTITPIGESVALANEAGLSLAPLIEPLGAPAVPMPAWDGPLDAPSCWSVGPVLTDEIPHVADHQSVLTDSGWATASVRVFDDDAAARDFMAVMNGHDAGQCLSSVIEAGFASDGGSVVADGMTAADTWDGSRFSRHGVFELLTGEGGGPLMVYVDSTFVRGGRTVFEGTFVSTDMPAWPGETMEAIGEVLAGFAE